MNTIDTDRLTQIISDALERTAFVIADPIDKGESESLPVPSRFSILKYSGPENGQVFLAASDGFVQELASSLLGVEPDEIDPATMGQEALNELANIVGGSVVLDLGGDDRPIKLHLPELAHGSGLPANASTYTYFNAEGELLSVAWIPAATAA